MRGAKLDRGGATCCVSVSGGCPACGLDSDTQLTYDATHYFRVASQTDADGVVTTYTYDALGQTTSRTDAANGPTPVRWTVYGLGLHDRL